MGVRVADNPPFSCHQEWWEDLQRTQKLQRRGWLCQPVGQESDRGNSLHVIHEVPTGTLLCAQGVCGGVSILQPLTLSLSQRMHKMLTGGYSARPQDQRAQWTSQHR